MFAVFGGELKSVDSTEFKDPKSVDFVGTYATREEADAAWLEKARATIDLAQVRYFVTEGVGS